MSVARTIVAVVAVLGAGCGGDERTVAPAPGEGAPSGVYYVGESFEGLPVSHADVRGERTAFFTYGTCEPVRGSEGGCATPLQLSNYPLEARNPAWFELEQRRPSPCWRTTVRGLPAAVFDTTGGALEVYVGNTVAVISASPEQALRAARALRAYGAGDEASGAPLPPPPRAVVQTLRRCASDSFESKVRALRAAARPVYWVGRRFGGHPLARVEGTAGRARFVYGECARSAEYYTEAQCWAPLELIVEPRVAGPHPSRYHASTRCRRTVVRGAPVAVIAAASTVHVFTRDVSVTMYARDVGLMLRAAAALRALEQTATTRPLPPPPRGLVEALASRCSAMRS